MGLTKEEHFLIAVYRHVKNLEDPTEPFDPIPIGKSIGYNPKSVEGMANWLRKGNFLRKEDEETYRLTEHGQRLARTLLNE